jgi:hypothetical protein
MSCTNTSAIIQKQINNEVRRPASMFTLKLNTCARTINNTNVGNKHSSYQRVLQRRRACAFA